MKETGLILVRCDLRRGNVVEMDACHGWRWSKVIRSMEVPITVGEGWIGLVRVLWVLRVSRSCWMCKMRKGWVRVTRQVNML